jgi:uncharacterized SAM-dependent methyltransferase
VYFPGSTIGNFNPVLGVRLLRDMRRLLNKGDGLLIGIDLKKDTAILNRAYNDKTGLTEAFNKNIILRINEELEGTFNPHSFAHKAFYNPRQGRMEMHLVSLVPQRVHVRQRGFYFRQNESIHTESSYKYTIDEFAELSCRGGFKIKLFWKDDQDWFAVLYLEAT